MKDVTSIRPLTAEEQQQEQEAQDEEAKVAAAAAEAQTAGKKSREQTLASGLTAYKSPNADKFVPDCISIRTSPLDTISDVLDFFRYGASLNPDSRFSIILDDKINEEVQSENDCYSVDLSIGIGCEFALIRGCSKPERFAAI